MSRSSIIGPGSLYSFSKLGQLPIPPTVAERLPQSRFQYSPNNPHNSATSHLPNIDPAILETAANEASQSSSSTSVSRTNRSRNYAVSQRLKNAFRLESQDHMLKDYQREREYKFCLKCGSTTVTVNFENVPSARVGLWGRCDEGKDYTHHKFVTLTSAEYQKMREWPLDRRLSYWRFEK